MAVSASERSRRSKQRLKQASAWLDHLEIVGERHRKVATLMAEGYRIAEIAEEVGIARRTVKQHLNRLYLQFRIRSGVKGVKLAVMLYRAKNRKEP